LLALISFSRVKVLISCYFRERTVGSIMRTKTRKTREWTTEYDELLQLDRTSCNENDRGGCNVFNAVAKCWGNK
jgi:hypothetical protein